MSGAICDVCGQPAVRIACSSLGAVSFAYCRECSDAWAEPYGVLVGMVAQCGGLDECAPWVAFVAEATVARVGKTLAQFYVDVAHTDGAA